jgi:hypothetical protein
MFSSSKFFRTASAVALLGLCGGLPLLAQTAGLGGIDGVVRDSSGAIVPGVSVVVLNSGTGAKHVLITDSVGHYSAEFLQPGTYEVILGGGSFGKVDRKSVPVTVGAPVTVDAVLPLASVTTDVTVSSDANLIDTEKVESSQVVDAAIVTNVPVSSRRFESFVLLTPNVVPDGNTGLLAFRGISGVYNTNIVDGGNNNQQFFSEARGRSIGSPYVFPVDSIKEFESSASNYSAELGGAAGGIINAITKSGTNQFHGDVFEFYRTPGYNALDAYTKYQGRLANNFFQLTQPVKVQHQYGVSVGGPIIKDKLFFHFTYDGYRKVNPITYLSSYNGTVNTISSLAHLCDGGTVNLHDGTTIFPTTIPNVSAAQCAAGVTAVQNQLGSFARNAKQDIYFPRLDYQLGQKTHLSAEFLFANFHQPNGYSNAATANNSGIGANGTADFHERILIANAETVLTSRSANVVHFQWARDLETDGTNQGGPFNSLSNIVTFGETSALPRGKFPDEHRWQATEIYSIAMGRHSIKAGFDLNFVHEQIANLFGGDGSFSYSNTALPEYNFSNFVQDALGVNPTRNVTAGAFSASTLARHYNTFAQTVDSITGVGADDFWNQNIDGFAEDSWKIKPTLLIQYGLRYDVQLVPGPDLPNTANAVAFNATSQINPNLKMFQPRVGFNWNPYPGTVVRGGYGMFYGQISNSSYYTLRRENGVYQRQYSITATTAPIPYVTAGTVTVGTSTTGVACVPVAPATVCYNNPGAYASYSPAGGVPIFTPPGPAPVNPITGAPITSTGLAAVPGAAILVRGLDPSFSNPLSHSIDLAVEQALPLHSSLTVSYVGNRALRLPVYVDTNVDPASAVTKVFQYTNPKTGVVSLNNQTVYTNRLSTTTAGVATGFSDVNSWYNSFVTSVKKPMSHGYELLANYTWAKAMDGGQTYGGNGTFNGTDAPIIPFALGHRQGRGAEYGLSDLNIKGRFVGTLVLKSQFGIANKFVGYAANGWLLSGTVTAQTGPPVTATYGGSTLSSLTNLGTLTTDAGVANASFTSGPSARVPNFIAGRNSFESPGIHNTDARLSRTFPILHDRYNFEVAAEVFNVANHRNILGVSTPIVSYTASGGTGCPVTATAGCFGALAATAIPFGAETSTTSTIYTPRQLQLVGKFTF